MGLLALMGCKLQRASWPSSAITFVRRVRSPQLRNEGTLMQRWDEHGRASQGWLLCLEYTSLLKNSQVLATLLSKPLKVLLTIRHAAYGKKAKPNQTKPIQSTKPQPFGGYHMSPTCLSALLNAAPQTLQGMVSPVNGLLHSACSLPCMEDIAAKDAPRGSKTLIVLFSSRMNWEIPSQNIP